METPGAASQVAQPVIIFHNCASTNLERWATLSVATVTLRISQKTEGTGVKEHKSDCLRIPGHALPRLT